MGTVRIRQIGVELPVAVEQRAGGEQQRPDLESVCRSGRGAAVPLGILLPRRKQLDRLVEALHDEIDALVERVARLVEFALVGSQRNLVIHDDDRAVVLQHRPMEIADQIPRFAPPLAEVLRRDVGDLPDVVEERVGVADRRIVVVVHAAGRCARMAHEVVVNGRRTLLSVDHALVAEPAGRALHGHGEVVAAAGLAGHPVLDVVGQVPVDGIEIGKRLILAFEGVLQRRVVLRNHIEIGARGAAQRGDAENESRYSVHSRVR